MIAEETEIANADLRLALQKISMETGLDVTDWGKVSSPSFEVKCGFGRYSRRAGFDAREVV